MGSTEATCSGNPMLKTIEEYKELSEMVETARDCLQSLRFGSHWLLEAKLIKHGILARGDRDAAIKAAERLCDEFMTAYTAEQE